MSSKYRYTKRKGHPLEPPCGRIPQHRLVLYDKIGPGPHPCFRCGEPVNWSELRTAAGALTVHHLDRNGLNNDPDNLVPSCHTCNLTCEHDPRFTGRPFLIIDGVRQAATPRLCEQCGEEFLYLDKYARQNRPNRGRFCSQRCARRWQWRH